MSAKIRLTDQLAQTSQPARTEYAVHDTVLRGFTLRVRPSGVKTWVLRIRRDGRPIRFLLGDASYTPADAARQRAHALLSGTASAAEFARPAITLKKFAALYLERRQKEWRPSTRRSQQCYLANQLLPALGKYPLDRIADMRRTPRGWYADPANDGSKHVRQELAAFISTFVARQGLPCNPG